MTLRIALTALGLSLGLTACSTVGDVFSQDTASDTIGLPRAEPGQIVIDEGDNTVPTPYGGEGAALNCETVARDIARLTAILGPDLEPAREVGEPDERGRMGQAREFASDLVEDAPEVAGDAARSAIVGLNPARPIIRFLGQAGEIEAAARREREIALKRRAWLRGAYDVQTCSPDILLNTLQAYNLLQRRDAND